METVVLPLVSSFSMRAAAAVRNGLVRMRRWLGLSSCRYDTQSAMDPQPKTRRRGWCNVMVRITAFNRE